MAENQLQINKWIPQTGFKYQVYWPYQDPVNLEKDEVSVEVQLDQDSKKYSLTFTTPRFLQHELECDESEGAYSIPEKNEVRIKEITHKNIETVISDLIIREKLIKRAFVVEE